MRVVLLTPPFFREKTFLERFYKALSGYPIPQLAIPILISYAEKYAKKNHDFKVVDARAEGLSLNQTLAKIEKFEPDIIGITAVTSNIKDAYKLSSILKEKFNSRVVMGGPHVTFMSEEALSFCDIVIICEGERTFLDLIEGEKLSKIRGISFKNEGKIFHNPDRLLIKNLDEIPFPEWDYCPIHVYPFANKFGLMLTSRGCPYRCIFCSSSRSLGKVFRAFSVKRTVDEIEWLVEKYGVERIEILDDNFVLDRKRAIGICKEMIRRKINIMFDCDARVDNVDRELLTWLKKAGCEILYFGVESADLSILKRYKKDINLSMVKKAFRLSHKLGLSPSAGMIIGPYDSRLTALKSLLFSFKIDAEAISFALLTPYPGTPLYEEVKTNDLISEDWNMFDGTKAVIRGKLSAREQELWQVFCSVVYHFNPINLFRRPKTMLEIFKALFKMV